LPRRRELQIRRGARFSCAGDGLCCSDIHALGPLARSERARVTSYDPSAVVLHPRLGLPVLRPRADHACPFFDREGGCSIHREHGALAKPGACRQFPFGLVKTPAGLRVTTAHRCPCRTMGERAPLDVEQARAALTHGGRLRVDQTVGDRVRVTRRTRVAWARYASLEARVLTALLDGTLARALADTPDLPPIDDATWTDVAHSHRAMVDGSTTGEALGWFGDALLFVSEGKRLGARARPWSWSFDRAEQRVRAPRGRAALYADFAADRIHSLRWAEESSLAGELLSLATALRCADAMASAFAREGASDDRAAAEALMIAEVALAGPLAFARFDVERERAMLARAIAPAE
jgi:Fe-S-cluster containining protein